MAATTGNGNKPDTGLALARMVGHITYLSDESMQQSSADACKPTAIRLRVPDQFAIELSKYNGNNFTRRFDANSLLV